MLPRFGPGSLLRWSSIAALVAFVAPAAPVGAQTQITLRRTFIEKYKNRVTIDATFTVDKAHAHPNPPAKDGDLHVAGRAPEISLPTVAEIINAAADDSAVSLVHAAEGTGTPIRIAGAWRIWCEHGGGSDQRQGAPLKSFTTTNPDHVFEIHPITQIGDYPTVTGWTPIEGYDPKAAEDAFERYESKGSKIRINPGGATVTINTGGLGYNYVRFKIVLNESPFRVQDGYLVMAQVLDRADELLVRNRRMVFANGTPPADRVSGRQAGDTLEVLGIPRINLAILSWRVRTGPTRPEVLSWNLPYEMIVVGVYGP